MGKLIEMATGRSSAASESSFRTSVQHRQPRSRLSVQAGGLVTGPRVGSERKERNKIPD